MFNQTRYGRYSNRTTINHNNAPATMKLLTFGVIVLAIAGIAWALFHALNSWTTGVGGTWTTSNNDVLIEYVMAPVGQALGGAVYLAGGVLAGVTVLAFAPWFIRNMRVALTEPIRGQGQGGYQVIDQDGDESEELGEPERFGLIEDGSYQEHYLDSSHLLTATTQPTSVAMTRASETVDTEF